MKTSLILLAVLFIGCAATAPVKQPYIPPSDPVELHITGADSIQIPTEEPCFQESCTDQVRLSIATRIIGNDTAVMWIYSGLSGWDLKRMANDFLYLRDFTNVRKVIAWVNSPGGDAMQGLGMAELIERWQNREGFIIEGHASGIVASAAVPIFAACKSPRYADPSTVFMVHQASIWKWPGSETSSDIKAQSTLMNLLEDRYHRFMVNGSNLSKEKWIQMEMHTTWFSAQEAKEWGLVQEIE